jgi:tRNA threonylcarbamoyl adenosine modification protein (Sua5/YciO/YrdC/YwlC family)
MGQFFSIHPDNPQPRLVRQAAEIIRNGGVIVYPTDSSYALGCRLGDKDAATRIRAIRGVDESHHMTLVCRDLAEISLYARVDNQQFRLLKVHTPGAYTFILEASREVPKRLQHPKRKTIGLRIPDHPVVQALLTELNEPLLSSTLILPGEHLPLCDTDEIREKIGPRVDLILESGACSLDMTTVIDLSGGVPVLIRRGKGEIASLGLE